MTYAYARVAAVGSRAPKGTVFCCSKYCNSTAFCMYFTFADITSVYTASCYNRRIEHSFVGMALGGCG